MNKEGFDRLSGIDYWETLHNKQKGIIELPKIDNSLGRLFKLVIKRVLGKKINLFTLSYANYLLWEVIFPKFLPKQNGLRIIEIGSAPGINLIKMKRFFAYEPYGLEYSDSGVKINRSLFVSNGINPDNVIQADFFSDEFHNRYRGFFDIVYSGGFLEHFGNVNEVIDRHINLLAKSGILIIDIPNLKGINFLLTYLLNKKNILIHNLKIMDKETFSGLFKNKPIKEMFCGYYGIFNLGLINIESKPILSILIIVFRYLQFFLNFMFHILFRKNGCENKYSSPYLIFIGKKTK